VIRRLFLFWAGLALVLDQASKSLVGWLVREGETVRLLGDFLRVAHGGNEHGVFGLRYGPQWAYYLLPVVGSAVVLWLGLRARDRWTATAFGLILGGAVGNLVDRVLRGGRVVDFVDMGIGNWRWFTYNVADVCLVVGIVTLLAHELFTQPERVAEPRPPTPDQLPPET
jgi:signal peptidase II